MDADSSDEDDCNSKLNISYKKGIPEFCIYGLGIPFCTLKAYRNK